MKTFLNSQLFQVHLKGYILQFDAFYVGSGKLALVKLLLTFGIMEIAIGPRMATCAYFGVPLVPAVLRVPALLIVAFIFTRYFARVKLSDLGICKWKTWPTSQKSSSIQIILIANIIFMFIMHTRMQRIFGSPNLMRELPIVAMVNLCWGFYQELIYRGLLQNVLTQYWRPVYGIVVSNLAFTFGPLHFYHFQRLGASRAWPVFVGIFLTGICFGVIYRRSGNLILVGALHGIGNVFIDGLGSIH